MAVDREQREHAFVEKLAREVAQNEDTIAEMFHSSKVGQCGGKCNGFKEANFSDLCPECLQAVETVTDEIFSVSPELGLLGDVMNSRD